MTDKFSLHFNVQWMNKLLSHPESSISGLYENSLYEAKVIIPNYKEKVSAHYINEIEGDLDQLCNKLRLPQVFRHFGIAIEFKIPLQLRLHDKEMILIDSLHHMIKVAGSVIIKNAYLDSETRNMGHKNRFPQLNFHVDRSEKQPTHYSMYTRNPFDEEQKLPRKSSTLFIASVIGYLQSAKEKTINPNSEEGNNGTYTIFKEEVISDLVNKIIVEHAWNEAEGTGEISIIDNITCLHASYYPYFEKGYKIGVRYVG
jgi:hypothetical protein